MKYKKWMVRISIICVVLLLLVLEYTKAKQSMNNQPLDGVRIVLDSGHGGKDNGADREGVNEDEINLEIAKELQKQLTMLGADIIMTRDGDYDLASAGAKNRKREDMQARVAKINEEECDLFISIHLNAFSNTAAHGSNVFYQSNNDASKDFADIIQTELNTLMHQEKQIKMGDYYILNETKTTGILVECGFLSNAEEREKLVDKGYQKEIAKAITKGIQEYFSVLS